MRSVLITGQEHKVLVDKSGGGTTGITAHKVRARVRYDPVTAITGQVFGPWRYMPGYMDGLGTHNNVPLPVELLYFEATCHEGRVHLEWATASGRNSSHFVVQRSADGIVWSDLGSMHAAGNSLAQVEYSYTDHTPWYVGIAYYRLVEHDLNGAMEVLPARAMNGCVTQNGSFVYPNPTNGTAHVDVSMLSKGSGRLMLLDAMGRVVGTYMLEDDAPQVDVHVSHLAAGSYRLHC